QIFSANTRRGPSALHSWFNQRELRSRIGEHPKLELPFAGRLTSPTNRRLAPSITAVGPYNCSVLVDTRHADGWPQEKTCRFGTAVRSVRQSDFRRRI